MCGIFGLAAAAHPELDPEVLSSLFDSLYRFSETRGREAAGLVVRTAQGIDVLKQAGSPKSFLASPRYREVMERTLAAPLGGTGTVAMAGHSRLVTNGLQSDNDNNQPVVVTGAVGIHNGIITNEAALWERHGELVRRTQVDTEVLLGILRGHLDRTGDPESAARAAFGEIQGSASVAVFFDDRPCLLLATNTGSLFRLSGAGGRLLVFASERFILQRVMESGGNGALFKGEAIEQVPPFAGLVVSLADTSAHAFSMNGTAASHAPGKGQKTPAAVNGGQAARPLDCVRPDGKRLAIVDRGGNIDGLKRCSRCVLTETYPLITFDAAGVCNYCRSHRPITVKGEQALIDSVAPYRSKDGSPDCIVAFSGGRDSTYGLHYVKNVLCMNPVAFTYDWGMVTDLARRNQARICGKLGIEHIIRSADIPTKRRYIRKNVEAWLKRPELGMVTLFTAGDKEFYSHARQLRKETGIKLVFFCTGNMIENATFKTGFCGIMEDDHGMTLTGFSMRNKVALLAYFLKQYVLNPRYLNESLWDTWNAFWQTFVVKDDFLYLFHYLPWDENTVVDTIRREYDWEDSPDTQTTWRIGDGVAALYNYIYLTMAGWTEDEAMLSNMVREGVLERPEALRRARLFSRPRYPSVREFAGMIGINCEEMLTAINAAPKLY
jgi:glucosamine--fructose-6-phosphate aminotransferase (isomerizing)